MTFKEPLKIRGLTIYSVQGLIGYFSHYYALYLDFIKNIDRVNAESAKEHTKDLKQLQEKVRFGIRQLDENERVSYWKTKYLKLYEKQKRDKQRAETRRLDMDGIIESYLKHSIILQVTPDQFALFKDRHYINCIKNGTSLEIYSLSGEEGDWYQLEIIPFNNWILSKM